MSQLRLLMVDDDLALLRAFERGFGRRYEVRTAASGRDALRALAHHGADVALVDYSMPEMGGVELLKRIAADHPGTGRLMLTAYADLPEVMEAKALQLVSAVLAKPWSPAEVDAAVARAFQLVCMRRAVSQMRVRVARGG